MKKYLWLIFVLFLIILNIHTRIIAKEINDYKKPISWGLNFGYGGIPYSGEDYSSLLAVNTSIFYQNIEFGYRAGGPLFSEGPGIRVLELLVGTKINDKFVEFAYSYGLSGIYIENFVNNDLSKPSTFLGYQSKVDSRYYAIGIPLEASIILKFYFVGISLSGYANINTWKCFSGIFLDLQLGKL